MTKSQHQPSVMTPRSDRSDTWPVGQHPYEQDDAEGCELPLEVRRRVRELQARLDLLEDCEVLDVPPDVDAQTLIRAYTALIEQVHPARYAGIALGGYGVKMEMVVARATAAYHAIAERAGDTRALPKAPSGRTSALPPPGMSLPPPPLPSTDPLADEVDTLVASAMLAERTFDWEGAATEYERAHALRPDAMMAARAARAIHRADGDLERAARLAEEASAKEPRNADFHVLRAMIYREAGLLHRAADACTKALASEPAHLRARDLLGKVQARIASR